LFNGITDQPKKVGKMAIKVKIEKGKDGTYWGTTQNIPGVVTADGSTLEELKENLNDAIELYIETAQEHKKEIAKKLSKGFELELEIKLSDVFKRVKVLNQSQFAKRIGLNPGLLRQYATKPNVYVSEKRANEIQQGLHRLGEELLAIKL
jgi:predicted RNase H-like HicB family nuclease